MLRILGLGSGFGAGGLGLRVSPDKVFQKKRSR